MNKAGPDLCTRDQLETLGYASAGDGPRHDRPLLICDVDEVVLHLVTPFMEVLNEQGFHLKSHSFKLTGNVFHTETGREATQAEVWSGLDQLFKQQDRRQHLVDGVGDALSDLNRDIDILFLTNMPHIYRELRQTHLAGNAMDYPIVTNTGSKVEAIRIVQSHRDATVGFIDDTPKNLTQVRDGLDDVHIFHFMANEDFRSLVEPIDGARMSTGNWREAVPIIRETLVG